MKGWGPTGCLEGGGVCVWLWVRGMESLSSVMVSCQPLPADSHHFLINTLTLSPRAKLNRRREGRRGSQSFLSAVDCGSVSTAKVNPLYFSFFYLFFFLVCVFISLSYLFASWFSIHVLPASEFHWSLRLHLAWPSCCAVSILRSANLVVMLGDTAMCTGQRLTIAKPVIHEMYLFTVHPHYSSRMWLQ